MQTKWLPLATADGPMDAYLAAPDGAGPFPGVVVMQEAFGVNAYVRSVCERLADVGYVALAPELFHRHGTHVEVSYEHMPRVMELLSGLTNAQLEEDVGSAVAGLRARPEVDPERLGVVGFCMGGFASVLTGLTTAVRAVVAFYPGGLVRVRPHLQLTPLVDRLHELRAATQIHFGGDDAGIPPEDVEAVRLALGKSKARHDVHVWPGAKHGFHSDDRTPVYNPKAAEDAWHATLHWFGTVLRSPA
ncbi:MAG: dienelactone hydrolase family protein [Acidobacteriota bacterium]